MKLVDKKDRFGELFRDMTKNRWCITVINLGLFGTIVLGIIIAMVLGTKMASEWKEILLLLIGAFLGNYNKVTDFWFSNYERDKLLVQKMDEEDGSVEFDYETPTKPTQKKTK